MNSGKQFEKDWKDSMPINVWFYRFRDSPATYDMNDQCKLCPKNKQKPVRFATKNICDCQVFKYPNLFLFELKTTKSKSLPFSMVKQNQIVQLTAAQKTEGIIAGFVVNFSEVNETYFMPITGYNYFAYSLSSKSIPIKIFRENCYKIGQSKKNVHWNYNIYEFLKDMQNGKEDCNIGYRNNGLFE